MNSISPKSCLSLFYQYDIFCCLKLDSSIIYDNKQRNVMCSTCILVIVSLHWWKDPYHAVPSKNVCTAALYFILFFHSRHTALKRLQCALNVSFRIVEYHRYAQSSKLKCVAVKFPKRCSITCNARLSTLNSRVCSEKYANSLGRPHGKSRLTEIAVCMTLPFATCVSAFIAGRFTHNTWLELHAGFRTSYTYYVFVSDLWNW